MTKSKGGRPTKYKPEFVKIANEYCEQTFIPFVEELAVKLGVWKEAVYNWGKKHKQFSYALKRIKQKQELALLKGSLNKDLEKTSAIFQLKCNHGYVETEKKIFEGEVDHKGIFITDDLKK